MQNKPKISQQYILFGNYSLNQAQRAEISNGNVEAQCLCHFNFAHKDQKLSPVFSSSDTVLLQIVGEFVVQKGITTTDVISAFRCDYEIQFEMIRSSPIDSNRLGSAEGLRFIFNDEAKKSVFLRIDAHQRNNLQIFCKILGVKFIVQLGFHQAFKAIKKIGKGMTACVYNALSFATGKEVAIKSFKRSVYFAQDNSNGKISFQKQFKILTQVKHKNICQLHGVFETENSTYVILELLPLSLYGYLQKFGFPNEQQAKEIITNLLQGVAYLHAKGIMHRDLKLQNIMVKKDCKNSAHIIPVIVDLGLAQFCNSNKYLYTRCGTPGYVAPEVLKIKSTDLLQTYTTACDIFSLGVIFYILLFKKPLFEGKDVKEVIKKNVECNIDFQSQNFKKLSPEGKDLFDKLLSKDPLLRITAREALNHSYLSGQWRKGVLGLEAQNALQTLNSIKE